MKLQLSMHNAFYVLILDASACSYRIKDLYAHVGFSCSNGKGFSIRYGVVSVYIYIFDEHRRLDILLYMYTEFISLSNSFHTSTYKMSIDNISKSLYCNLL